MADDKNFKELIAEQKKFTEEQKKATIALNKIAKINEEQGPPLPPDNKDVVDGLDKLGKKIEDGDKNTQQGYDTSDKNKFVMEKKAIEDRRKAQDEFKKAIEAQGGDVKRNYAFQREQTKITKADFALKRKLADTPGSKKELKKEEAEALKDAVTGPLQRGFKGLTGAFGKLSGIFKGKFGGSVKSLGSLLKFGIGGLALMALSKFLKSETWAEWKDKLVPMLVKAFDFVTSVLGSAVEKITTGFKAAKVLFDGFFNEKGEFDFIGGIKNLVKNVDCIGPAIVGIGLAFAAVSVALLPVAGLLLPKLLFGGLMLGGKWLIAKPFIGAFKVLAKGLGLGAKGLGAAGGLVKAGFWSKTITTAKGIFSGVGNRFTNLAKSIGNLAPKFVTTVSNSVGGMFAGIRDRISNLAAAAKKIAAPVVKAVTNTVKPIASLMSKGFKGASSVAKAGFGALTPKTPVVPKVPKVSAKGAAKAGDAAKKFKGFGKLLKIGKNIPFLGKIISGGILASLLLSGKPAKEMVPDIAALFGGIAGAGIGASAGTALGTLMFPGVGSVVGGLIGAVVGGFGGDVLGTGLAEFMLGLPLSGVFGKGVRGAKSIGKKMSGLKNFFSFGKKKDSGADISPAEIIAEGGNGGDVGALPTSNGNGGGGINYFPAEGGGSTPVANTMVNAPSVSNSSVTNTQTILKNVVEPDPYFLRQSGWAI